MRNKKTIIGIEWVADPKRVTISLRPQPISSPSTAGCYLVRRLPAIAVVSAVGTLQSTALADCNDRLWLRYLILIVTYNLFTTNRMEPPSYPYLGSPIWSLRVKHSWRMISAQVWVYWFSPGVYRNAHIGKVLAYKESTLFYHKEIFRKTFIIEYISTNLKCNLESSKNAVLIYSTFHELVLWLSTNCFTPFATVRVFRSGRSYRNAQWIWSRPLSGKRIVLELVHGLSYSASPSLLPTVQLEPLPLSLIVCLTFPHLHRTMQRSGMEVSVLQF
jgi:hypothetical protein